MFESSDAPAKMDLIRFKPMEMITHRTEPGAELAGDWTRLAILATMTDVVFVAVDGISPRSRECINRTYKGKVHRLRHEYSTLR